MCSLFAFFVSVYLGVKVSILTHYIKVVGYRSEDHISTSADQFFNAQTQISIRLIFIQ
jgi:hypothetical protein